MREILMKAPGKTILFTVSLTFNLVSINES